MPSNIAHMLIAHKALGKLKDKGVPQYAAFADLLDDASDDRNYRAYMNLGSLGPDLFYYRSLPHAAKDMLVDGFVQAVGVAPWAYPLHSHTPNLFPLRLVEVLFHDVAREDGKARLDPDDIRKLAYIAGHLTHVAADQIIHPLVNRVAGPYYKTGENRRKHRECEVFQDYFVYEEVYRLEEKGGDKYDFFQQDFRGWTDCVRGVTFTNTLDWFRYFLQRGFVLTYGAAPAESDIEHSVDNLLLVLRGCKTLGPYKKLAREYEADPQNCRPYVEYVRDPDYVRFYRQAVELGVVYLMALYEVYARLGEGLGLTAEHRQRFLSIVSDADLACPLEEKILDKASAALKQKGTLDAFLKTAAGPLLDAVTVRSSADIGDASRSLSEVVAL